MMGSAWMRRHADLIGALLILLSAGIELGLRELFYHISSEAPSLLLLVIVVVVLLSLSLASTRVGTGRALVVVAVGAWLQTCGAQLLPAAFGGWLVLLLIVGGVSLAACQLTPLNWGALRRALAGGALIFVGSQPVLAGWRASELQWPSPRMGDVNAVVVETTVVVLLDELSANAASPIVEAMARSGQPVLHRSLHPAGDGTAKVVSSMFAGQELAHVKPCGWHTLCSGSAALDFDRITASRPDIDIVGFYIPYCSIGGLRFCQVLSPSQPYLDLRRWHCAAQRRSDWLTQLEGDSTRQRCAELNGQVWAALGERVEEAIWRAPVWERGGVLYVHAPLPHPPGEGGSGSLEEHYRANIEKAATLVGAISQRLADQPRSFSLIVFSDHPLRTSLWCSSKQYKHGCAQSRLPQDESVPLLVTGTSAPRLEGIRSNLDVFRLIHAKPPVGASQP